MTSKAAVSFLVYCEWNRVMITIDIFGILFFGDTLRFITFLCGIRATCNTTFCDRRRIIERLNMSWTEQLGDNESQEGANTYLKNKSSDETTLKLYQASDPLPLSGGGTSYDVCFTRTERIRGQWTHFRPLSVDETSPLLPVNTKQGLLDDGHTFPKRVQHSAAKRLDRSSVTGTTGVIAATTTSEDSSHDVVASGAVESVGEPKSNQRRSCVLAIATGTTLILISAAAAFYFLSPCPVSTLDRNRIQQCSFQNFMMSTCQFTCKSGFIPKGSSQSTCDFYRRWSSPHPTCVCPSCYAGPQCQYSRDWNVLVGQLKTMTLLSASTLIHYGNHTVTCEIDMNLSKLLFKCTCEYVPTNTQKKCNNFHTAPGACIHALANLIEDRVGAGVFAPPCNAGSIGESMSCPA